MTLLRLYEGAARHDGTSRCVSQRALSSVIRPRSGRSSRHRKENMLDYNALAALAAVAHEGSFECAARQLHVTPSAISQRIKLLEARVGRILIDRGPPCAATAEGLLLCRHAEGVNLLEHARHHALPWLRDEQASHAHTTLRTGVNADSLASWFLPALAQDSAQAHVLFDVVIEDQDHTLALMRSGHVLVAVTAQAQPLQGFHSTPSGSLRYRATASPAYMQRYFSEGVNAETLAQAPALRFNQKDALQTRWMAQLPGGSTVAPPNHWIASAQSFVDACVVGLGWGINPANLVQPHLDAGRLVQLAPGLELPLPLFWHCVQKSSALLMLLGQALSQHAREVLTPANADRRLSYLP